MKSKKAKILTFGLLAAMLMSSTPTLAATKPNSKIDNKTVIQKQNISENQKGHIYKGNITDVYYWCGGDGVRVRSQPNSSSKVLGLLYYGDSITVDTTRDDIVNGYHRIIFNGQTAYISEQYVRSAE